MADNTPQLGQSWEGGGFVTRFGSVGASEPGRLDALLGYKSGTLGAGYKLVILAEPIRANHVVFAAYTHASGGRWGSPATTPAEDARRPSVHREMGEKNYDVPRLQRDFAQDPRNLMGHDRIVKIVPDSQPPGENPAEDYPAGLGIPQWILTAPHRFYVAVAVDAAGTARTAAGWSAPVGPNASYGDREKLFKYVANLSV